MDKQQDDDLLTELARAVKRRPNMRRAVVNLLRGFLTELGVEVDEKPDRVVKG